MSSSVHAICVRSRRAGPSGAPIRPDAHGQVPTPTLTAPSSARQQAEISRELSTIPAVTGLPRMAACASTATNERD
jgi:hypothetical protein